ncbi:Uncharacterised protein family (UPF0236) [Lachnospiraceae bacterium]|nr:Uncharacterised protein family (UPF0236) [Lachnospiraceae bacterium]
MVNSVKYFNEVCIKKIYELSAELAENPKDFASYVKGVTDQLSKLGVEIIKETLEEFDSIIRESTERKEEWYVERRLDRSVTVSLGEVSFKRTLFKKKDGSGYAFLLDDMIGLESHTRISADSVERILEEAVQTSYRRGGENASISDATVSKQATKNIIHKLKFPETEKPKTKKEVEYLYIDADEDHVSLQFREEKGDISKSDNGFKNNSFITKLVYVYEGIEKEAPKSKRHRLVNPYYFCSTTVSETNEEFWDRIYQYVETTYDVSKIKKIYVNGDGGSWIKGCKKFANVTFVLDEFHMGKYLTKMTSHLRKEFSQEDVKEFRGILKEIIKDNTKTEFRNAIDYLQEYAVSDSERERIADAGDFFLSNWTAAKMRLIDRKHVKGCSAEGHVSHVLSSRMSSRPMGWSKLGATKMAELRAYYLNGGDLFELARFQRTEISIQKDDRITKVLSAANFRDRSKNELGEIGRWYDTIPYCELPATVKKKFAIRNHIYGL